MKLVEQLQDRIAGFVGVSPDDRIAVIESMLRRSSADNVGYWLQLVIAMGIATLGLAMGSTAVVIGAMLVSPLMAPIIELGMGLATGSLLLTFRAGVRTAASVAVVVLSAAALTRLLPFHELNAELLARTSPTMIDLFIAAACALAAVYTTVRQGKDTISTAAGTAIGIALVPPLCTAGYGLGIGSDAMLQGAILLFTANFAAIAVVTAVMVLLLGFGQVELRAIEADVLDSPAEHRLSHRAARLTKRALGRRLGVLTRVLLPAAMLGAILVPLARALEQVSWQVRVRSEVEAVLAAVPGAVVRQSLEVRGGTVSVRLLVVGSADDAREVTATLRAQLAEIAGGEPVVEVVAVPDAATLDAMAATLNASARPPAPPPPPPPAPPPPPPATTLRAALDAAIAEDWPAAAGTVRRIAVELTPADDAAMRVTVVHQGPALGEAATQLLARAWRARLDVDVVIVARALPAAPITAAAADGAAWLDDASAVLATTAGLDGVATCVTVPAPPPPPKGRRATPSPPPDPVRLALDALIAGRPDVVVREGDGWSVAVAATCEAATPPPAATPAAP